MRESGNRNDFIEYRIALTRGSIHFSLKKTS